jgi:hypothetical protein
MLNQPGFAPTRAVVIDLSSLLVPIVTDLITKFAVLYFDLYQKLRAPSGMRGIASLTILPLSPFVQNFVTRIVHSVTLSETRIRAASHIQNSGDISAISL